MNVRTFAPEPSASWNITWLDVACTYGISLVKGFPTASSRRFWELGVSPNLVIADNFGTIEADHCILKRTSIGGLSVVTYPNNFHCSHFPLAVAKRAENIWNKAWVRTKTTRLCINLSASLAPHTSRLKSSASGSEFFWHNLLGCLEDPWSRTCWAKGYSIYTYIYIHCIGYCMGQRVWKTTNTDLEGSIHLEWYECWFWHILVDQQICPSQIRFLTHTCM